MKSFITRNKEWMSVTILTMTLSGLYAFARGVYFDSNDDPLFAELMRGIFFGEQVKDFFIYHKLLAYVYSGLYALVDLPWYSIIMMIYFLCSASVILFVLNSWMKHEASMNSISRLIALSGIFLVGFSEGISHLSFTRNSIMLCTAALLLLMHRKHRSPDKLQWTQFIFPLLLFLIGTLTRPQSAILVLGLSATFVFFIYGNFNIKKTVQFLLPFVLILGADKAIDRSFSNESSGYYRSVIPYLFNILDAGSSHLPEYPTETDVTKYQAVSQWFLADRNTVNPEFLSRIASADVIGTEKVNAMQAKEAIGLTIQIASTAQLLLLVLTFVLAILSCLLNGSEKALRYKNLLPLLLINFLFIDMLLFITVFIKMVPRVLDPSITILIVFNVIVLCMNFRAFKEEKIRSVLPLSVVVCSIILLLSFRNDAFIMTRQSRSKANAEVMAAANSEFKDKLIVFTLMSMSDIAENSPAFNSPFSKTNRYMIIDGGWTTLVGEFPRQIEKLTGKKDLPSLFAYFTSHSSELVFISTPERNALLQTYMSKVYGISLDFKEFRNSNLPASSFGFYQLN